MHIFVGLWMGIGSTKKYQSYKSCSFKIISQNIFVAGIWKGFEMNFNQSDPWEPIKVDYFKFKQSSQMGLGIRQIITNLFI